MRSGLALAAILSAMVGLSCLAANPEPLLKGHPVQPIELCRLADFSLSP